MLSPSISCSVAPLASMGMTGSPIHPPAKQACLSLTWVGLFLLGCACNSQIPPATLYQKSSATKATSKVKYILSPSKTASGVVPSRLHTFDWTLRPLCFLSCLKFSSSLYRRELITIVSIAMHHWHGHCIHIALLISMWYGNKMKDNISI